jgi:hypothetical protein
MLVAVLVVLVAVFFVATGRGGELSRERPDYAPLDLGPVSATDVALLRPPTALWGYNVEVTDEALNRIALVIRDRDARIAYLQQQLAQVPTEAVQDRPGPQVPYAMPAFPIPREEPQAGPDPAEHQNPAGRHHRVAEDDIVPWDQPADHDDLAEDGPVGQEGPAGSAGE